MHSHLVTFEIIGFVHSLKQASYLTFSTVSLCRAMKVGSVCCPYIPSDALMYLCPRYKLNPFLGVHRNEIQCIRLNFVELKAV